MSEEKLQKIYKYIMIIAITVFVTFLVTSICISNYYTEGNFNNILFLNSDSSDSKTITSLNAIRAIIDKYYLGEKDEQKLTEGAIKGYVEGLGDPYSEYITAAEMEEYKTQLLGNYVGIGIYMIENQEYNMIQVLAPIKESPAAEAGILPGDLIRSIDGVEYTAENMTVAANKIKGKEGTTVKLVIIREAKEIEFVLTRRTVLTNPISEEVLDNNIGYLEVSSFDQGTAKQFKEKFQDLQKKGITSLVIDLRNNGGGLVSEALEIADYIAEKGENLLITVDKNNKEEISKSKQEPIVNIPVIILVNENTASASEILAGALKDLNKATIVGVKTYGKGVIQQIVTLTDGSGLKLTIEEYFTPNKNKINNIGIEPNETVELPESVENPLLLERKDDTQLDRTIEILKNK
jgi:carboxyl-terminal processing protease